MCAKCNLCEEIYKEYVIGALFIQIEIQSTLMSQGFILIIMVVIKLETTAL